MSDGPYSRVYWSVLDDKKFDGIRADVRHFGSWTLMLVVADMAYPAPAFIPPTVPRASLKALVDVGLIDLLPARMYRIRGLKKEREQRSDRGRKGADVRWSSNATALRTDSERTPTELLDETKTRRDETRQDEADTTREADLFSLIARSGAFIRPDSGFGIRIHQLIDRRGIEAVLAKAELMAATGERMSDRQWVLGLENAIEQIPTGRASVETAIEERATSRSESIQRQMWARRMELFRESGKWDEAWGPKPEGVAS